MNKLNSVLAAGLIALAGAGVAATPVFAANTMLDATRPTAAPTTSAAKMHHVSRQARVERVQKALNASGASLTVDGKWGPKTVAAVKDFQKAHGIRATGHMNKQTRQQLFKA